MLDKEKQEKQKQEILDMLLSKEPSKFWEETSKRKDEQKDIDVYLEKQKQIIKNLRTKRNGK